MLSLGAVPRVALILIVVAAVVGPMLLLRRFTDRRVLSLSVVACVVALAFVPLIRVLPERAGIYAVPLGIWLAVAIITMALAGNAVRFVQSRRRVSLAGLALGLVAAYLFYASIGLR